MSFIRTPHPGKAPLSPEITPFLADNRSDTSTDDVFETVADHRDVAGGSEASNGRLSRDLIGLFCAFLIIQMGIQMITIPLGRIIESAVCYEYWKKHDPDRIPLSGNIPEATCKSNAVQASFAMIQGYWIVLYSLSSAVLSIPYGLLAKRVGRRPVMALNAMGYGINAILLFVPLYYHTTFPTWTIWLSPLSWVIGGGPVFLFSTLWNMAANASTESGRAVMFARLWVMDMGAICLGGIASSSLMTLSPWIPVAIGNCLNAIGLLTILFRLPNAPPTPHTDSASNVHDDRSTSANAGVYGYNGLSEAEEHSENPGVSPAEPCVSRICLFLRSASVAVGLFIAPYSFLIRNGRIWFILPGFFVYEFYSKELMVQYLSVRFGWTLARAGFILAFQPAFNIPFLLFAFPYMSKRLRKHLPSRRTDLYLARLGILCFTIAMFCVGLASSFSPLIAGMFLHAAGAGYIPLSRAIVTGLVEKSVVPQLYTVVEALRAIGGVIGIFSVTSLFKIGLGIGGVGIGLPWLIVGVLFALVGLGLWAMPLQEE
ncbi:major facilitator superfamily domain-containing protein [Aspergillus californicus]